MAQSTKCFNAGHFNCHLLLSFKKLKRMINTSHNFIWFVGFLQFFQADEILGEKHRLFVLTQSHNRKQLIQLCPDHVEKRPSSQVFLWLNSLREGEQEPERSLSTHLNPPRDTPAQVSYSGGSKMSLRGVFTDLVTPTRRPLGRQVHRYRIAFLVASVAIVRLEVTGLHFFL